MRIVDSDPTPFPRKPREPDFRSFGHEQVNDGATDSGTAADDEDDLALQESQGVSLSPIVLTAEPPLIQSLDRRVCPVIANTSPGFAR